MDIKICLLFLDFVVRSFQMQNKILELRGYFFLHLRTEIYHDFQDKFNKITLNLLKLGNCLLYIQIETFMKIFTFTFSLNCSTLSNGFDESVVSNPQLHQILFYSRPSQKLIFLLNEKQMTKEFLIFIMMIRKRH